MGIPSCCTWKARATHLCKPKVGEAYTAGAVNEQVLGLYVAVAHAARVAVRQPSDHIAKMPLRMSLRQCALTLDELEKVATADELENNMDARL